MSFLRKKIKFYYFILLTSLFITFVYNLKFLKILYGKIGFSSFPSIYFFFAIIIAIISAISILKSSGFGSLSLAIFFKISSLFCFNVNMFLKQNNVMKLGLGLGLGHSLHFAVMYTWHNYMINSIYTSGTTTIQHIGAEAITLKANLSDVILSDVIPSGDNTFSLYDVELYRHRFI